MTRPDIEGIKARAEAATPGPWGAVENWGGGGRFAWLVVTPAVDHIVAAAVTPEDAVLSAAARTDIPALLAYIDELEAAARVTVRRWVPNIEPTEEVTG